MLVVSLCCDLIGLGFAEVQYIVELIMTLVQLASKTIRELIGRARLKLPVCFVASVEASRGSGSLACSARTKQVVMCKVRLEGLTDRPCESKEKETCRWPDKRRRRLGSWRRPINDQFGERHGAFVTHAPTHVTYNCRDLDRSLIIVLAAWEFCQFKVLNEVYL